MEQQQRPKQEGAESDAGSEGSDVVRSVTQFVREEARPKEGQRSSLPSRPGQQPGAAPAAVVPIEETDDAFLFDAYLTSLSQDAGTTERAFEAYDEYQRDLARAEPPVDPNAPVRRRAPLVFFTRPKKEEVEKGRRDPALRGNPLHGRLIALFTTSAVLFFVFLQSLVYNDFRFGTAYAPFSENGMLGPSGITLYELGGLNTNAIRNDNQVYRLFWAAWMHSGWIHIGFNVLCQMQFFFMLEPDWGFWRAFLSFFVSGIVGNLVSAVADPCTTTVGSSGGLFGLMGALIPYCIEFWQTIPRPGCIILFSLIVIIVSIIVGFTGNTDNWAHMGGLVGGLLFSFATVTTLTAFRRAPAQPTPQPQVPKPPQQQQGSQPQQQQGSQAQQQQGAQPQHGSQQQPQAQVPAQPPEAKPKVIHRSHAARMLQQKTYPDCACGRREWAVRVLCAVTLVAIVIAMCTVLFSQYEFQPVGHVSFSSTAHCRCCFLNLRAAVDPRAADAPWFCFSEIGRPVGWTITWGEFCQLTREELEVVGPKLPVIDSIGRRLT